jgi:hypothetical protein
MLGRREATDSGWQRDSALTLRAIQEIKRERTVERQHAVRQETTQPKYQRSATLTTNARRSLEA